MKHDPISIYAPPGKLNTLSKMADGDENVDSMETDSASEGRGETFDTPKRPDNLCCYSQKECDLEKLKGFDFCHKHILEDKDSPFKPCSFISKTNGKKCTNPAPKLPGEVKTFCLIHTRDAELRKALEKTKKKKRKLSAGQQEAPSRPLTSKPGRPPGVRNYTKRPKVLELGAEYRKDDVLRVESSWHGDYESDTESLDNDMDDPLRHAGVWTAEEAAKMCRDKLLRLRSLYLSQFERLKHVYKNKRRKYLLAATSNEEGVTDSANAPKANESLSAFHIASRSYNKRYRNDALLQKQSKEKRLGTTARSQILPQQRCTHYTDGNRCTSKVAPMSKFCLKHICDDPNQQLFLACSQKLGADQSCSAPVPNVLNHAKCILHLPRTNELSVGDLEEELQQAKEHQTIKEREIEDRRKAAIAQAAHEAMLSEIAKSEALAAQHAQNAEVSGKMPVATTNTGDTQPVATSSTALEAKHMETPASTPSKLPGSPSTNLQVNIQPSKSPEVVDKNAAPVLSNQADRKIANSPLVPSSSHASATVTAPQVTSRAYSGSTLSIPSKLQVKPVGTSASQLPTKSPLSAISNTPGSGITPGEPSVNPKEIPALSAIGNPATITDSEAKGLLSESNVVPKLDELSKPDTSNTSEINVDPSLAIPKP